MKKKCKYRTGKQGSLTGARSAVSVCYLNEGGLAVKGTRLWSTPPRLVMCMPQADKLLEVGSSDGYGLESDGDFSTLLRMGVLTVSVCTWPLRSIVI